MFVLAQLGRYLSSRDRARVVRCSLEDALLQQPTVTIDAAGVVLVSHSFADELFGVLVQDHGDDWFRTHVRVINLAEPVRESILQAIHERLAVHAATA